MKQQVLMEMEKYAIEHDVPIMQKEGIEFMTNFIKEHNIKSILEIGSAIGYSAIQMALVDENITITTIERDHKRYELAKHYVNLLGLNDRITLMEADALKAEVSGEFDMLFIDAAKAQYIKFFERYEVYLKTGGYIISDNLSFHGYVEHPELIQSRDLRQLIRKIKWFIDYLKTRNDYETTFLSQGDGIGISKKL